ncbi:hypothetical protein N7516_005413 [Penicillium verrucosum]|uniref:uncharacterized protein n=1 Tax=Penicillium verrucosum TaxID=60171 RepID=UPI0025459675|nr:uncharacterized protein N7516_005413 [Penicillium verrucosum]KAJ5945245.1 hypothetical protein N7516_005413 [Penicillium verrucosum]
MPGRVLPTFTSAEVQSHNNAKSCYITLGSNVYDVTDFLDAHPGGGDLILEYAGKDVTDILKDEISHEHTDAAYEILDEYHIGFVSNTSTPGKTATATAVTETVTETESGPVYTTTGMSREEDLSMDTDYNQDFKTHKFLDLSKPLLIQLWNSKFSKEFYLEQIHRPRHYRGGESAPLFGNFLEPLSKTAWYVVPIIWLPCVAYGLTVGATGLGSSTAAASYFSGGVCLWTLIEYLMHRFLFHIDHWLPDNRVGLTLHFLLHGIHHYLPMDKYRLVMPPTLFVLLAAPFWKLSHAVFYYNWYAATSVFCGGSPSYYKELKKYHLQHHFADFENGFGVTSRFWDRVFGTELVAPTPKGVKAQ